MGRHRFVRHLAVCAATLSSLVLPVAAEETIRIGVLSDMSGPYADIAGKGSVAAAELAAEEFGGTIGGRKIEIISADHQNKPDIGLATVRRWFDNQGVDIVVDVITSSVALAVQHVAREKNKVVIFSGAGADQLAGEAPKADSSRTSRHDRSVPNADMQELPKRS